MTTTLFFPGAPSIDAHADVVGVSGGAPSALATAAVGGDRVERLTIVSGFPHPQHGLGILAAAVELEAEEASAWAREPLADAPIDDVEPYVESMVADLPHLIAPWRFDVSTITAPTTIFHAVDDDRCPVEGARWLAEAIPGARYVEWPDGGHNAGFLHLDELYEAI